MSSIKYLIVLLSSRAPSICHYSIKKEDEETITTDILDDTFAFAFKENASIHYVFPDERLSEALEKRISQVDGVRISSSESYYKDSSDIIVYDTVDSLVKETSFIEYAVLSITPQVISELKRINTDVLSLFGRIVFSFRDFGSFSLTVAHETYKPVLDYLSNTIIKWWSQGGKTQISVLTDLLFTSSHLDCKAGIDHVTVSPHGHIYICPGFYSDASDDFIGDIHTGFCIPNQELLALDHAPICRKCDAFQCKRCLWLNRHMTREINTPSKEQCVISHIERNCTREMLSRLRIIDEGFLPHKTIPEIDHLDPLDILLRY